MDAVTKRINKKLSFREALLAAKAASLSASVRPPKGPTVTPNAPLLAGGLSISLGFLFGKIRPCRTLSIRWRLAAGSVSEPSSPAAVSALHVATA
jgi:hypothetical protein